VGYRFNIYLVVSISLHPDFDLASSRNVRMSGSPAYNKCTFKGKDIH